VVDYSTFNTNDNHTEGLTKLYTELISGRIPDILDMTNLPVEIYAARGLLVDLNPFLDNDPDIRRGDLMDGVLRAAETDGALYRIFSGFTISTVIGHPSVVGDYPGWSIAEFRDVINSNPQADFPMGTSFSRESFLKSMLEHNIEQFVDLEAGVTRFESREFIELLELASIFPSDRDTYVSTYVEENEMIQSGRQIMMHLNLGGFTAFRSRRSHMGGEVVLKGFPAENINSNKINIHNTVAITVGCEDKDGAWEFVRMFLTEEFQREIFMWRFPINRNMFQELLTEAMDPESAWYSGIGSLEHLVLVEELSQNEADEITAFIDSITGTVELDSVLWNIISESASELFNGQRTAEDAARIIQSRVARYVAEMS